MILSDREIQAAMRRESIQIAPTPTPKSWSSTAVDLRLDTKIRRWKPQSRAGMRQTVCPASPDFNYTELANEFTEVITVPDTLIFEEVHGTSDKGYEGMFAAQGPEVAPIAAT